MIFVIDDDEIMAECLARAAGGAMVFTNAIEAMQAIAAGKIPKLIFLDLLLDGPDGITFLHELMSYVDTATIPVVVVSSLDLKLENLSSYGVVGMINKDTLTPEEVKEYVENYTE